MVPTHFSKFVNSQTSDTEGENALMEFSCSAFMTSMEDEPKTSIAKASCWGGGIFAGLTVVIGACLYFFGSLMSYPVSGLLAIVAGGPANLLIHCAGIDHSPMVKVFVFLNGVPFAALVNAILGGLLFAIAQSFRRGKGNYF